MKITFLAVALLLPIFGEDVLIKELRIYPMGEVTYTDIIQLCSPYFFQARDRGEVALVYSVGKMWYRRPAPENLFGITIMPYIRTIIDNSKKYPTAETVKDPTGPKGEITKIRVNRGDYERSKACLPPPK